MHHASSLSHCFKCPGQKPDFPLHSLKLPYALHHVTNRPAPNGWRTPRTPSSAAPNCCLASAPCELVARRGRSTDPPGECGSQPSCKVYTLRRDTAAHTMQPLMMVQRSHVTGSMPHLTVYQGTVRSHFAEMEGVLDDIETVVHDDRHLIGGLRTPISSS